MTDETKMTDTEYWKLSAVELAELVRSRRVSCVAIMESVLGRIAARNGELNAIVTDCGAAALNEAMEKDRLLDSGTITGPLHGVPVTIKVNIDVAGQATTNGVPDCSDLIASEHSPVVSNLLDAGAIIVGRTNTPEFSMRLTTDNPLHGRTINPWNSDVSPGGSSGGASVAAAMGFGPIHHGNDIGGSLRMPAFACGVSTIKPTFGRVPAYVPSALGERGILATMIAVQGVICREVRDVRLATRELASGDPRDPWWVPVPFDGPELDGPIPVAVTTETYGYPAHPDIINAIDHAAGILDDAGYRVEQVATPPMDEPAKAWVRRFDQRTLVALRRIGPRSRKSPRFRRSSLTTRASETRWMRLDTARRFQLGRLSCANGTCFSIDTRWSCVRISCVGPIRGTRTPADSRR